LKIDHTRNDLPTQYDKEKKYHVKEKLPLFVSIYKQQNRRGIMILKMIYILFFLFYLCATSWSAQLQINTQTGKNGEIVTFTVFIHNAPDPVNAFGFEIAYDPTCMIYKSVQRGALISNGFTFFQASNVGLGRIRVGGIETGDHLIPKQAVGSLALIQFSIIGEKNSSIKLENLKDDLKTWSIQNGQLILQTQETNDTIETETESIETEENVTLSENDLYDNSDSSNASDIARHISTQSQTSSENIVHTNVPEIITNIHKPPNESNSTLTGQKFQNQQTDHSNKDQRFHQSKLHDNNLQQVNTGQKQRITQSNPEPSYDEKNFSQSRGVQQDSQQYQLTETLQTLKNNHWGHIKSAGFSSVNQQNSAFLQNPILMFPTFINVIIVISIIFQIGVLIILLLIYRQLKRMKGGDMK
jgi:hypothetical protein